MSDIVTISLACSGEMHMNCEGCGCLICHHECTRCGKKCRKTYKDGICAECYRDDLVDETKVRTRCESCAGPGAYRDTREDDRFLCTACHKAAGHRYQLNGRWITNDGATAA